MMKSDCQDYQALFSDYYDGYEPEVSLTGEITREQLEAHLQKCAVCAGEYKKYTQFLDEIWELPEPGIPLGFHSSLMEYVEAHMYESTSYSPEIVHNIAKRRQPMYRKVVALAASVAVIAASFLLVMGFLNLGQLGRRPHMDIVPSYHTGIIETFDPAMAYNSTSFTDEPFGFPGARANMESFGIESGGGDNTLFYPDTGGTGGYIPISPAIAFFDDFEFQYEDQYTPEPNRNNIFTIISISLFVVGFLGFIFLIFERQKKG